MEQIYSCEKCNKEFKLLADHKRHAMRKIPCVPEEREKYFRNKKTCDRCGRMLTSLQGLRYHQNICKVAKSDNTDPDDSDEEPEETAIVDPQQLITQDAQIQKIINKIKQEIKEEMSKSMEERIKKEISKVSGKNKISIYNTQNNFKITAHGKEDLSHMTNTDYKKILNKGFKSVPGLVEHVHFNKNNPENHNIYISNMRDNYVLIYDGENWKVEEKDVVLQKLIEDKSDILIEKFDELIENLDEYTIKKFRRFLNEKDDDATILNIKKDLKKILYNNKQIPEKTRGLIKHN